MGTSTFLRIAAIITLLYFAGHTSGIPWTPDTSPEAMPVLAGLKSYSFDVLGSTRTYWDFYLGFGIVISLFLLVQAVVLWQLASMAKTDASRLRPIIASFFVLFIFNALLGWMYFFVIPMVMSIVISACLAIAFVTAGRSKAAQEGVQADRS